MPPKKITLTRQGMTRCPACLSHIKLELASLHEATCPFCHAHLLSHLPEPSAQASLGQHALSSLKGSKSAMLAATLGVSLAMSACDKPPQQPSPQAIGVPPGQDAPADPGAAKPPAPPQDPIIEAPAVEEPAADIYGGPPVDDDELIQEPIEPPAAAIYGGPAMMDGPKAPTPQEPPAPIKPQSPKTKVKPKAKTEPTIQTSPSSPDIPAYGGPPKQELMAPTKRKSP